MHKTILTLVETHSKVSDSVPSSASNLVNRVLVALVGKVTDVALRCFREVPKYGTGGMLTVSPSFVSVSLHEY
jgi:exocyst complex component 2